MFPDISEINTEEDDEFDCDEVERVGFQKLKKCSFLQLGRENLLDNRRTLL